MDYKNYKHSKEIMRTITAVENDIQKQAEILDNGRFEEGAVATQCGEWENIGCRAIAVQATVRRSIQERPEYRQ